MNHPNYTHQQQEQQQPPPPPPPPQHQDQMMIMDDNDEEYMIPYDNDHDVVDGDDDDDDDDDEPSIDLDSDDDHVAEEDDDDTSLEEDNHHHQQQQQRHQPQQQHDHEMEDVMDHHQHQEHMNNHNNNMITDHHNQNQQPQVQVQAQPQAQPEEAPDRQHSPLTSNNSIDNEPPLEGYTRTSRIGQGAYGIVYKGIQRSTNTTVAIKRIPFGDATPEGGVPCNVIREISLLRELDHRNVVKLLDVNQSGSSESSSSGLSGELFLIFEYVDFDLKTFMDKNQRGIGNNNNNNNNGSGSTTTGNGSRGSSGRHGLSGHIVRSFMRQILEGVAYCHTYRILHRDLKPHNVSTRKEMIH